MNLGLRSRSPDLSKLHGVIHKRAVREYLKCQQNFLLGKALTRLTGLQSIKIIMENSQTLCERSVWLFPSCFEAPCAVRKYFPPTRIYYYWHLELPTAPSRTRTPLCLPCSVEESKGKGFVREPPQKHFHTFLYFFGARSRFNEPAATEVTSSLPAPWAMVPTRFSYFFCCEAPAAPNSLSYLRNPSACLHACSRKGI